MKKNSGVSMITLVITIIVIIILAAVAFNASTETIGNANFSDFVNNVAEVQSALDVKVTTVKGEEGANGVSRTDAQVYNYVAKGAKDNKNWLTRTDATNMDCTAILAGSGLELPETKVSTPNSNGVVATYFVTNTGKVFVWPPFVKDDGTAWINGEQQLTDFDVENIDSYSGEYTIAGAIVTIAADTANVPGEAAAVSGDGATVFYGTIASSTTSPVGRESSSVMFEMN